jgi:D-arabinose 1-dehydrogenase-like Zn-dependent alcohol dehydrogenase
VRAAQISAWGGPLELVDLPDPVAGEAEVLVRVEACGVGRTVLNSIAGDAGEDAHDLPRVPGHELVGTVVAAGPGADPGLVGKRICAYFYLSCGSCASCLGGYEPLCDRSAGYVGVQRDGGYAELCALPAFNALLVPAAVEPVAATTIPDAIATPVHVARRVRLAPGSRVAVVGAGGGLGVHMVQVAAAFGADVAGLDIDGAKLAYLEDALGVTAVDAADLDRTRLPWNRGADVVVDFIGTPESLEWGVASLRPNGTLVCLTTFRDRAFELAPRTLVLSQLTVIGSRYASRDEVGAAARLVAAGRIQPVIGRRVGLDELESLHEQLRRGAVLGRGALVWA